MKAAAEFISFIAEIVADLCFAIKIAAVRFIVAKKLLAFHFWKILRPFFCKMIL